MFSKLMFEIDTNFEDYQLAVLPNDKHWEYPLPELGKVRMPSGGQEVIILSISGWTRENSYWDPEQDGMVVVTAFGNDENTAQCQNVTSARVIATCIRKYT